MFKAIAVAVLALIPFFSAHAESQNAKIKIYNNTNDTVYKVQTSPIYANYFGPHDLLEDQGIGVIMPHDYEIVDFDVPDAKNECKQEIRLTFKSGRKLVEKVNVCTVGTWTINNN